MLSVDKKNGYALVCSLLIHLLLFAIGSATATYVYGASNGEIFETMDYIENVELTPEKPLHELNKEKKYDKYFEMMLCSDEQLKQVLANVEQIKIPKTESAIRNKLKAAIVNTPAVPPKLVSGPYVPYPADGDGKAGTVLVCVLVGVNGKPEYVSIAGSSGSHILDGAAMDNCINWNFSPARDASGKNVRCLIYIPVRVER